MSEIPDLSDGVSDFVLANGSPFEEEVRRAPFVSVIVQPSTEGPPKVRLTVTAPTRDGRIFLYPVLAEEDFMELTLAVQRAYAQAKRNAE